MADPNLIDYALAEMIAADKDDEVVVCCLPISHFPAVPSATHQCATCGRLVWISSRILSVLPARARVLCMECAEAEAS